MKTVEELMNKRFHAARAPRSPEYKDGVRAILEFRINGTDIFFPYQPGTAACDAFYSGIDEGHAIWTRERKAAQEG
jgi:hypothetical protein